MRIWTKVDEVCGFLEGQKEMKAAFERIEKGIKLSHAQLESITKVLVPGGLLSVEYPVNVLSGPQLVLKQKRTAQKEDRMKGKQLEAYDLKVQDVEAKVAIVDVDAESRPIYDVERIEIGPYTQAYLDRIKEELARSVPVAIEEMVDPRKSRALGAKFREAAEKRLGELPGLTVGQMKTLSGLLLQSMYGLGDIELLMSDDLLEEIAINTSREPISVYHRKYGWLKTSLNMGSEDRIYNY